MRMGLHIFQKCLFHTSKEKIAGTCVTDCLQCKPYQVPKGCDVRVGRRKCPFSIKPFACARIIHENAVLPLAIWLSCTKQGVYCLMTHRP